MIPEVSETVSRGTVSLEEKNEDLSAHLLMLVMALENLHLSGPMQSVVDKAREALKRSGK